LSAQAAFIPGLELSRRFYYDAIRPVLEAYHPGLPHAAALIGPGSEVLGFDTPMSTDHCWGPRLLLFLNEQDCPAERGSLHETLARHLPPQFLGYSTHFSEPDPQDHGTQLPQMPQPGELINHRVEIHTLRGFCLELLGWDMELPLTAAAWLTFPQQKLLSITAGAVYWDEIGLEALRARVAYFPQDVWLYLLAAGWARIGQEEHLTGRAGFAGDELGSKLIAARLVRDCMRLAFMMERVYMPYPKWFGSAFARLACSDELMPHLQAVLGAPTWQEREPHLCAALELLAGQHNRLGLTGSLDDKVRPFFGRPFRVLGAERFSAALLAQIRDPQVRQIAAHAPIGSIDLFSDSTDLLEPAGWGEKLQNLFRSD
jgi:hypothetical protein